MLWVLKILLFVVQGHQLQEKAGKISHLCVTLDSVRAEVTTLTQKDLMEK